MLGDMLELGRHTFEAHKKMGEIAAKNCDILIVVGPRAKAIREGALEHGMAEAQTFEFSNSRQAGEFVQTFVKKNDIILVKGSQGVRMERAVEAIMEDKANKDKLLVRQDLEWQSRP